MLVELEDVKKRNIVKPGRKPVINIALFSGWTVLAILNVLDVWSTETLLNSNQILGEEANPVARWLIDHSLFLPVKILVVALIGYYCLKTEKPKKLAILIWLIVPLYLFVVAHNISYM